MSAITNKIIIGGAVLLALAGIYFFSGSSEKMEKNSMTAEKENTAMMDKDDSMMEGEMMMKKGSYESYSPEKLSLANGGKVLLFFHADWCPVCRNIEAEITGNQDSIPSGIHILKVDYDKEISLRQKYGVTVQHTFVQVDSSGGMIQKFNDASTLSKVLSRVK